MDKKKTSIEADQYLDRLQSFFKKPGQMLSNQTKPSKHSKHKQLVESDSHVVEDEREAKPPAKRNDSMITPPPAPVPPPTQSAPPELPAQASGAAETPNRPAAPQPRPPATAPASAFREGAIVSWGENTIGIFKEQQLDKGYDLVYMLGADGSVRPKGIVLSAYNARELGILPVPLLQEIANTLQWKREHIIFHIADFQDCELVPEIKAPKTPPQPTPLPTFDPRKRDDPETQKELALLNLVRGMRFEIQLGDRKWEAVYWNQDAQGTVIAHKTHGDWALMHLDLKRFKDSMVFKGRLSPPQRQELENSITGNKK